MNQIFHIAPASVRPIWFLLPIAILVIVVGSAAVMMAASVRGARTSTFELSNEGLRLHGDMYGRLVPANELRGLEASRVDVSNGPFRPSVRTLGTAVPGYRVGWFRLANGEKALLYVTDPARVVRVPTTAGYSLLLSVAETDKFVEQLHAMGGRAAAMSGGSPR